MAVTGPVPRLGDMWPSAAYVGTASAIGLWRFYRQMRQDARPRRIGAGSPRARCRPSGSWRRTAGCEPDRGRWQPCGRPGGRNLGGPGSSGLVIGSERPGFIRATGRSAGRPAAAGRPNRLLQLDAAAGLLDVGLELLGLLAVDALLDRLGRLVHQRLRLLEAETGHGAHDLDHLDLLVARRGQDHVNRRVALVGARAVGARRRGTRR